MTNIRIVTDSTADIPDDVCKRLGIEVIPLKVHFGEDTYLDGVTLKSEAFYEKLSQSDALPTTSQPSPVEFLDVYKKIIAENPQVHIISVHLSSALSGTYQSAVLAKSLLEEDIEISIIDSKLASYGTGLLAVKLAEAVQEGKSVEACLALQEKLRNVMGLYFIVDTLVYLQKGGRIGKASAMVGSLLNIKPILTVDEEGEVASVDKVRGTKKAMERIIEILKKTYNAEQKVVVYLLHSKALSTAESFVEKLEQHFLIENITYSSIGPVIGTHVGPGAVAVVMVPAEID